MGRRCRKPEFVEEPGPPGPRRLPGELLDMLHADSGGRNRRPISLARVSIQDDDDRAPVRLWPAGLNEDGD